MIGAVYAAPNAASRAIMLKLGMRDAGMRDYLDEGPLCYCEMRRAPSIELFSTGD